MNSSRYVGAEWDDPAQQAKSIRNSQNRQTKEGLNMHSGGSISASKHCRRMRNWMSREPNFFDIYKRFHRAKGKPDEYIILQARKIAEEYERRIVERQSQNGEGSSQESDNNIYLDVVRGPNKKGCIYRLGSQAASVIASSSTPSPLPLMEYYQQRLL